MNRIKNMNQLMTGVFLILVAFLAFYLSWPLSSKTQVGLGAGFVPKMLAGVQLVLGGVMVANGFVTKGEEPESWQFRPLLILAGIAFFALTIERLGLAIALVGLVLISCLANRETKFFEALALAVGSVVFSEIMFVKALGLSIELWPSMSFGG